MTNDHTETFVQDVNQQLRDERMITNARRFAPLMIGVFLLVLAVIGGWQVYQSWTRDQARKGSQEFAAAQQLAGNGNMDGAKAAFLALTTHGPENYRVMARAEYAAVLQAQGDLPGSLRAFDQAATEAHDPMLRESAQLRAAYIAAETQDFPALQHRLAPLLTSKTRISYLAKELLAIQAWKAGQNDLARQTLQDLSLAFGAPEAVRQRAQIFLSVIGPASTPTPAQPATTPQAPSEGETK